MVGKPVSQTLSTISIPNFQWCHPWGIFQAHGAPAWGFRGELSSDSGLGNPRNLVSIYKWIYILWKSLVIVNDILVYGIPNGFTHVMNEHSIICKWIWLRPIGYINYADYINLIQSLHPSFAFDHPMIYSPWPIPGQLSLFWPHSPSVGASRSPSANPASVEPQNGDFLPITEGMAQLRAGQLPKDLFLWMPGAKRSLAAKQNIQNHPKLRHLRCGSPIFRQEQSMEQSVRHHLFESSIKSSPMVDASSFPSESFACSSSNLPYIS